MRSQRSVEQEKQRIAQNYPTAEGTHTQADYFRGYLDALAWVLEEF